MVGRGSARQAARLSAGGGSAVTGVVLGVDDGHFFGAEAPITRRDGRDRWRGLRRVLQDAPWPLRIWVRGGVKSRARDRSHCCVVLCWYIRSVLVREAEASGSKCVVVVVAFCALSLGC